MLVKIKGTKKMHNLVARDAKSGQEYTQDLLSNDPCVTITEAEPSGETCAEMDEESYQWWGRVIDEINRVDRLTQEYKGAFKGVDEVVFEATQGICDLDEIAPAQEAALKEAFGEL